MSDMLFLFFEEVESKYLFDAEEFGEFFFNFQQTMSKREQDELLKTILDNHLSGWVEFLERKTTPRIYNHKGYLVGFGFFALDKDQDVQLVCAWYQPKNPKGKRTHLGLATVKGIQEDPSGAGWLIVFAIFCAMKYLQTEFVEATKRSYTQPRITPIDGKKYEHFSAYAVKFRKQPRQITIPSQDSAPKDWHHQWRVQGHWRKIKGTGKDESGDRCEEGRTWVKAHTRGPEDAPMLNRPTIVRDSLPPRYKGVM